MAEDLYFHGFEVSGLYDRFPEALAPIQKRGGIEFLGEVMAGFAPMSNVTTDLGQAIRGADVVAVVVPVFAHDWVAAQLAPHLTDGQIVMLTPGYPFGTLIFRNALEANGLRAKVDLCETNLILYATRIVGPAQVGLQRIKKTLWISALPASRTAHVLAALKPAIPQLEPLSNVLEVGFNCTNPLGHVPTVLMNLGAVERLDGSEPFDLHDWMTPGILKIKDAMDAERGAVLRALGVRYMTHAEMLDRMYPGIPVRVVPMQGPVLEGSQSVPPRIALAGMVKGTDFWKEGRTLERSRLAGKTPAQILAVVNG